MIEEILNELQPYVTGIRYVQTLPVVDTILKEGWKIPKSRVIQFEQGEKNKLYFMFYSEKEGIGFDEIIDFIKEVIKYNIERELKTKLLKEKINELKKLFSEKSLNELENLKFSFGSTLLDDEDEILLPEESVNVIEEKKDIHSEPEVKQPEPEPQIIEEKINNQEKVYLDDIELPPKEMVNTDLLPEEPKTCNCGPDEICPICAPEKYG